MLAGLASSPNDTSRIRHIGIVPAQWRISMMISSHGLSGGSPCGSILTELPSQNMRKSGNTLRSRVETRNIAVHIGKLQSHITVGSTRIVNTFW